MTSPQDPESAGSSHRPLPDAQEDLSEEQRRAALPWASPQQHSGGAAPDRRPRSGKTVFGTVLVWVVTIGLWTALLVSWRIAEQAVGDTGEAWAPMFVLFFGPFISPLGVVGLILSIAGFAQGDRRVIGMPMAIIGMIPLLPWILALLIVIPLPLR